jgi:hypothetical protein
LEETSAQIEKCRSKSSTCYDCQSIEGKFFPWKLFSLICILCFANIIFFVLFCQQDIISSSEKTTSRELFAALDKASEETSFSNDIRHCKDDEIFEGSKPTTSNDVACISYVIERKLVGHLIVRKEVLSLDTCFYFICLTLNNIQYRFLNGFIPRQATQVIFMEARER